MVMTINPFSRGFSLAEMTEAINLVPAPYARIRELGLFRSQPIAQRQVLVESRGAEIRLLPAVEPGAPASVAAPIERKLKSFVVPHIPHNDTLLASEVAGLRVFGSAEVEPVVQVLNQKLEMLRVKHAQTLEYMQAQALTGRLVDGAGRLLYDWHAEFDVARKEIDFKLGTNTTDIMGLVRQAARHIEANLAGETMSGVYALVSPEFFDRLTAHPAVKEAYQFAVSQSPLRDDVRQGFRFGPITFAEYAGAATLSTGQSARFITEGEGVAFPLGTRDTFVTYFAPADLIETVGTLGLELYARQVERQDGRGIDLYSESNPLPMVRRPNLVVRLYSSN